MGSKKVSESQFKEIVLKDLRSLPSTWIYKTQERSIKGIPDVIGCSQGKFIAIELKKSGEEPSPIQEYRINQIRDARGLAFWTSPEDWPYKFSLVRAILGKN